MPSRNEERAGWPILEIVDRSRDEPWKQSLLSSRLLQYARDPDCVVVCVLNAPGRARRLACRSCRALQRCERCQAAVAQTRDGQLRCARCGLERPVVCQACGSSALVALRPGVTALAEQVGAAAGRPAVEVTGEDAGPPEPSATLFVGTEAVLHRVPRADVVAFLDFDDELLAPRFRADEQALGLLARAARLAGPRADGGRVLVQTRLPHHEVLDAVLHADPGRLVDGALARRAELELPPTRALAVLSGAGAEELATHAPDGGRRGRQRPGGRSLPGSGCGRGRPGRRPGRRARAPPPGSASRSTRPACDRHWRDAARTVRRRSAQVAECATRPERFTVGHRAGGRTSSRR